MKTSLLFNLCLLIATALPAREFTDPQGRKLEAEVVSVTGGQAVLKRTSDGRAMTVNIATFSDADQKFLKDFGEANMTYSFDVRQEKKKTDSVKAQGGGMVGTIESWLYEITLRNRSTGATSGCTLKYSIYMKELAERGRQSARIVESGTIKMADMAP